MIPKHGKNGKNGKERPKPLFPGVVAWEDMNITMTNTTINIQDISDRLKMSEHTTIVRNDGKKETYQWIRDTLIQVRYPTLTKREKGEVLRYLSVYGGYSMPQIKRLVRQYRETGRITMKKRTQPVFPVKYTVGDVALLAEVADVYEHRNGVSLAAVCREMYERYGDMRFVRLRDISVSHIYNLKKREVFMTHTRHYTETKSVSVPIGERRKPDPLGIPGYIWIDTVHQGDLNGKKGVYHINMVDAVTQWQMIVCVEGISEKFLLPALEEALETFPFRIINFHSDNGSEYINHRVAGLLRKLNISQTKGRPRHCNDNALAEGKHAATIRKYMGRGHIPARHADRVNEWFRDRHVPFLNFHHPCLFPEETVRPDGKIVKRYRECMTPVGKLLSLPDVGNYLRDGVTEESLLRTAREKDHLTAAGESQAAKITLFSSLKS